MLRQGLFLRHFSSLKKFFSKAPGILFVSIYFRRRREKIDHEEIESLIYDSRKSVLTFSIELEDENLSQGKIRSLYCDPLDGLEFQYKEQSVFAANRLSELRRRPVLYKNIRYLRLESTAKEQIFFILSRTICRLSAASNLLVWCLFVFTTVGNREKLLRFKGKQT